MPPPPEDQRDPIAHTADELGEVRRRLDAIHARLGELTAENAALRERLEHSETARRDLLAQTEHLIELLANSRKEIRELKRGNG